MSASSINASSIADPKGRVYESGFAFRRHEPSHPHAAPGLTACLSALAMHLGAVASPQPAEQAKQEVASGVFIYEAPIALADANNLGAITNLGFVIGGNAFDGSGATLSGIFGPCRR